MSDAPDMTRGEKFAAAWEAHMARLPGIAAAFDADSLPVVRSIAESLYNQGFDDGAGMAYRDVDDALGKLATAVREEREQYART